MLALQVQLTQLTSLPPLLEDTSNAQQEITLASKTLAETVPRTLLTDNSGCFPGDTLEMAVFLSVKLQDEAAFERNYQQLQMYTSDARYLDRVVCITANLCVLRLHLICVMDNLL